MGKYVVEIPAMFIKITPKKKDSCEIKDFVEAHLCKLFVITSAARTTRGFCMASCRVYSPYIYEEDNIWSCHAWEASLARGVLRSSPPHCRENELRGTPSS